MQHSKQRFVWWSFAFLLVVVAVVLGVLRSQAPLSVWMIGSGHVATDLARRAAAGDPVEAEKLDWAAARPGVAWNDLGLAPPGPRELLMNPDELESAVLAKAETLDWVIETEGEELGWLRQVEQAELLTLDEIELFDRWQALAWMQRDPARWASATQADRLDRILRSWAMTIDAGDPCELGIPAGIDSFFANSYFQVGRPAATPLLPDPQWIMVYVDHCGAQLDEAAMFGDAQGVLDAARRFQCLLTATGAPVNLMRGMLDARHYEQYVRQVEAVLPLLSHEDQRALCEQFLSLDANRDDQHLRATRAERAFLHQSYATFVESGGGPFGGTVSARPLHGEFLICLRDYDELLLALGAPNYVEARDRMLELENKIESSERGVLSKMTMRGQSKNFLPFARNVALQRCARIAALRVTEGVETAQARAALTRDPFDGNALRTRVRGDGVFEVWSIGEDGLDDGGITATTPTSSDRDITFRVPALDD
jgi:hypothetical protein